ncbi:MAG: hypothetical protein JNM84_26935 [Planctomycetes bacterium]|nr:hypothetical protein [Planctomycetota bacterium]
MSALVRAALAMALIAVISAAQEERAERTGSAVAATEGVPRGVWIREAGGAARRTSLPCRLSFASGETNAPEETHHLEDRGTSLAAEWRVLTRWPDGSVRDAAAIVPLELEAGGERWLELRPGPGPAAPQPHLESQLLARLPASRDGKPWLELVSEIEDHAGTIHRARLRLDESWSSPHHGGLIQSHRFRDYHRGVGSTLERDLLTLTGWIELRSDDPDLYLDLQLGNDYSGVAKKRGQLDPEALPLGCAVQFKRWTVRLRGWYAAVLDGTDLRVPMPRSDLGWICFDLLPAPPGEAGGEAAFHALLDGQTLVRRFLLRPFENDPGAPHTATFLELGRRASRPLVARPHLAGLRASGAYGLHGAIGPASAPHLQLARRRAEIRSAILQDPKRNGPWGFFGARVRSFDLGSGSSAPLLSWYQGVEADFDFEKLSTSQVLALRPVHLFGVDAFAQAQWRGELSLGRPVNLASLVAWIAKTPSTSPLFASRDPALFAPTDELLELYLATLQPQLLDQLRSHQHRSAAAARVPFTTSTRMEAELLRAAVLAERVLPEPRLRRALVERWRELVLPGMAQVSAGGAGPYYVVAQEPRVGAWGPDIYWDSPGEAGLFAAAAIAAWHEWREEVFLEGALRAGEFIASAWIPLGEKGASGLAREIPVFSQERGERVPLRRDWYLSEAPIEWPNGDQQVRTTRRARLRAAIDEHALRCESALFLLAELARELPSAPGIPDERWRSLPALWDEMARQLHAAAPQDDESYDLGSDPWRQVGRDRATRGELAAEFVANPKNAR